MTIDKQKQVLIYLKNEHQRLTEELINSKSKVDESMALDQKPAHIEYIRKRLHEFERALAKLDAKTYGVCDGCGLPIPAERLEALPQTVYCIACKSKKIDA